MQDACTKDTVAEARPQQESTAQRRNASRVSDFYRHTVSRVAEGGETVVLEVENQPSGLGWLPDGSLLVVSMKDHRLLRVSDGEVSTHADLSRGVRRAAQRHTRWSTRPARAFVGDFGFEMMGGDAPAAASLRPARRPDRLSRPRGSTGADEG
jgi:hypothetical protein